MKDDTFSDIDRDQNRADVEFESVQEQELLRCDDCGKKFDPDLGGFIGSDVRLCGECMEVEI